MAYIEGVDEPRVPLTVAETPVFSREADRILGEQSHRRLIAFLGLNPEAGAIVPDTGGVRKLRWAVPGKGKRGCASHLLLSRRITSAAGSDCLCEEREDKYQPRREEASESGSRGVR